MGICLNISGTFLFIGLKFRMELLFSSSLIFRSAVFNGIQLKITALGLSATHNNIDHRMCGFYLVYC